MATKDLSLPFKGKPNIVSNDASNGQYNNVTLNQTLQNSSHAFSGHPKSYSSEKRKDLDSGTAALKKLSDFAKYNVSQTKKDSHSWNKSTQNLSLSFLNNSKKEDGLKKRKNDSIKSNSTLSLHILDYENSIETSSILSEKCLIHIGDVKQIFMNLSSVIEHPFEFARQQESDAIAKKPEHAQFKASQRLLNPNQMNEDNYRQKMSQVGSNSTKMLLVNVVARVRPASDKTNGESCVKIDPKNSKINVNGSKFKMDKVFDENVTQEKIFIEVGQPIIDNFLNGLDGTIFAYGQTGSGKTHTMIGNEGNLGITGQAIQRIFANLNDEKKNKPDSFTYTLTCSFLQLYNDIPSDLLDRNEKVTILTSAERIDIKDAAKIEVNSFDECMNLFRRGCEKRTTAKTFMNDKSSRSHAVFMLTLVAEYTEKNEIRTITSRLNLVDLAGSERQSQTKNAEIRLGESGSINKSLTTLARVIDSIIKAEEYVPYRDSKLTLLLRDSLGGNSKTTVIVNINPKFADETISTLNFASNVKKVKNSAFIKEIVTSKETSSMKAEVQKLRQENAELIITNQNYQKRCAQNDEKIESLEKELKEANDRELQKLDETFVLEEGKAKLEVKLEYVNSDNQRYDNEVVKKNSNIKTSNKEMKELRDRIAKLEVDNESLSKFKVLWEKSQAEVAEKDRQIHDLRNEMQRLSENFGSLEVETGQSENQFVGNFGGQDSSENESDEFSSDESEEEETKPAEAPAVNQISLANKSQSQQNDSNYEVPDISFNESDEISGSNGENSFDAFKNVPVEVAAANQNVLADDSTNDHFDTQRFYFYGAKLIVFDRLSSKCYGYTSNGTKKYYCDGCIRSNGSAKNGTKSSAQLKQDANGKDFVRVNRKHHRNCEPVEIKYKEFKKPNYEIHSNKNGQRDLIIFDPDDNKLCYQYCLIRNVYCCNVCRKCEISRALIFKDGNGDDFVKAQWNHKCKPTEYFQKIRKTNFETLYTKGAQYLIVFQNESRSPESLCYKFFLDQSFFRCLKCLPTKTTFAKTYIDENGEEYVRLLSAHICDAITYDTI